MTVRVNWLMGENLDPPWTLGEQRFEVEFEADAAGVVHVPRAAPAGRRREPRDRSHPPREHCVNAIPYVCAAEPGIKTYLDLPLLAGRATRALSRTQGVRRGS